MPMRTRWTDSRWFATGILILRFKVKVMDGASEVLGSFQFALDERLVYHHFGDDVSEFTPLPPLHLLSHGLEVPLHAINTNRDAVDERERFRVFGAYRREHT